MSDPDAVLNRIDDLLAVCICGRTIPQNGPSPDYCSLSCQYQWAAGLAPVYDPAHDIREGTTDGRTINDKVNAWFRESSNSHPEMGWSSAAVTCHDTGTIASSAEPRVELFPSPRPGEPIELAAGVDLTPYIASAAWSHEAIIAPIVQVGDRVTTVMLDGETTHSVVTSVNEDGSYDLEPAEGNQQ